MLKFAAALLVSVASTALANSPCDGIDATNPLFQCLNTEYAKADAALNKVWADIRASYRQNGLSDARYNTLVRAQQAWIPFRDADCAFSAMEMEGGTFEKVLRISCLLNKTQERTQFLQDSVFGSDR